MISKYLKIILLSFVIIILCFSSLGYSQRRKESKSYKECIDSFEIELAYSDYSFRLDYDLGDGSSLTDYFRCVAASQDNSGICGMLPSNGAKRCREHFKRSVGFLSSLFSAGMVTPEVLRNCPFTGQDGNIKNCRLLATAIIQGDDSECRDDSCRAIVNLDIRAARSQNDRDMVYFAKAIKEGEIKNCSHIIDKKLRRECQAYINRDSKICNEDIGFKKIRHNYCQYYLKK